MGDSIITLIWPTDSEEDERTEVFGRIESVGQSEFFAAAQTGLKPALKVTVWENEYEEQPVVVVNGRRYAVYRTYCRADQRVELYLTEKIGVR